MPVPAALLPVAKALLSTVAATTIGHALSPAAPPPPQGAVEVRTTTGKLVRIQPHPHQHTRVSVSALGGVKVHAAPAAPAAAAPGGAHRPTGSPRALPHALPARGGSVRGAALQAFLTVAAERLSGWASRDATTAAQARRQPAR
jgi:hypothetical protein